MYRHHTPVEVYEVGGFPVFVKRDDLFAAPPAPPLAKLRGLKTILQGAMQENVGLIGCFEASKSNIGHGLAAACLAHPGLQPVVAFPSIAGRNLTESLLRARELGAELMPIRNNLIAICHRQAAKFINDRGGFMIPFGFECPEAVKAVEDEAKTISARMVEGGTVVVACGSGVTLAGLLRGLPGEPNRIIGVSVGRAVKNIHRCVVRFVGAVPTHLEIRPARLAYRNRSLEEAPFPCNAWYDLKAWEVIAEEIDTLTKPILFWNVGG